MINKCKGVSSGAPKGPSVIIKTIKMAKLQMFKNVSWLFTESASPFASIHVHITSPGAVWNADKTENKITHNKPRKINRKFNNKYLIDRTVIQTDTQTV